MRTTKFRKDGAAAVSETERRPEGMRPGTWDPLRGSGVAASGTGNRSDDTRGGALGDGAAGGRMPGETGYTESFSRDRFRVLF